MQVYVKTVSSIFSVAFLVFLLTGCGENNNIDNINRIASSSEKYTQDQINSAYDIVISYFNREFLDCTLTDIWYNEAEFSAAENEWKEQDEADRCIVLLSNFDTGSNGGDGSLNPNDTYRNWQWILVSNDDEPWIIKTYGYG